MHRLVPALASVKKDLIHGSLFFGLAASTGSTRAAAQQNRVIDAINGLGPDFLRGLGRYRVSQAPLVEDPDKYVALLNFFQFGHQIFQHSILQTAALLRMTDEYLKIYPEINKITDFNNRLIMSDITKAEGYTFGKNCQSDINALGEASKKFYELVLPVFEGRDYAEVRSVFIDTQLTEIPQDFERLVQLKEANSLHNASLAHCRPIILGTTCSVSKAIGGISHESFAPQG